MTSTCCHLDVAVGYTSARGCGPLWQRGTAVTARTVAGGQTERPELAIFNHDGRDRYRRRCPPNSAYGVRGRCHGLVRVQRYSRSIVGAGRRCRRQCRRLTDLATGNRARTRSRAFRDPGRPRAFLRRARWARRLAVRHRRAASNGGRLVDSRTRKGTQTNDSLTNDTPSARGDAFRHRRGHGQRLPPLPDVL